jgi:quinol-cytochrome oxidoreductase complex cytochrome b subunit
VGQKVAYWLWGGYSVDNATLTRFFTFHFLVPFLMVGLTFLHLALLHAEGSTNPIGLADIYDSLPFYPYFLVKDIFGFLVFLFGFSYLVFFEPNLLGHPDNYIRANPLVTPAHIVPEWYFLPFYAILRAIPSKLGGVVAMGAAVGILFLLPTLDKGEFKLLSFIFRKYKGDTTGHAQLSPELVVYKGPKFRPLFKFLFSFWVANFLFLGFLGGKPVEFPYVCLSLPISFFYFFYFIFYF